MYGGVEMRVEPQGCDRWTISAAGSSRSESRRWGRTREDACAGERHPRMFTPDNLFWWHWQVSGETMGGDARLRDPKDAYTGQPLLVELVGLRRNDGGGPPSTLTPDNPFWWH